ncbi:MAG: hypothetical protein ACI9MC_001916, partial [Kiritimatiellia bacterium]
MSDLPPEPIDGQPVTEPMATVPTPKKKRRWLVRLGCGGLIGAALVVVGLGGCVVFLLTPPGQYLLQRQVVGLVDGTLSEGHLEVGQLETDLVSRVVLTDVALKDGAGRVVVGVDHVQADVDLLALLWGEVHLSKLALTGLHGDLQNDDASQLDVARMFGAYSPADPNAEPWAGLPVDLVFDTITVVDS